MIRPRFSIQLNSVRAEVRKSLGDFYTPEYGDGNIESFTSVDDPFDDKYGPPFFGFYGVCDDGLLEHIADFKTYADAVGLARKLAPGIQFPDMLHSR